jgi:hypothetical protein
MPHWSAIAPPALKEGPTNGLEIRPRIRTCGQADFAARQPHRAGAPEEIAVCEHLRLG